ncbi:MAG: hypothetical protein ACE360_09515, partial [Hyphomicrobiales bacterium]
DRSVAADATRRFGWQRIAPKHALRTFSWQRINFERAVRNFSRQWSINREVDGEALHRTGNESPALNGF